MNRIIAACFLTVLSVHLAGQDDGSMHLDSVIGYRLDTTEGAWHIDSRELHRYNAYGKHVEKTNYAWDDERHRWVGASHSCDWISCEGPRYVYSYDASGNLTVYEGYSWFNKEDDWHLDFREERTYDGTGNLTSLTHRDFYIDSELSFYYEYAYGYTEYFDASGNVTEYISFHKYGEEGTWINDSRDLNIYDPAGNPAERISQTWNEDLSMWENSQRWTFVFDSTGYETSSTLDYWDHDSLSWVPDSRTMSAFNDMWDVTETLYQYWDSYLESWINQSRYSYSYDSLGNEIDQISYDWQASLEEWEPFWRYSQEYDENGKRTDEWNYRWEAGGWIAESHAEFTYDIYGFPAQYTFYYWNDDIQGIRESDRYVCIHDSAGHELEVSHYHWNGTSWKGSDRTVRVYDAGGRPIESTAYLWDRREWDWIPESRETQTWDSLGNEIEHAYWSWNASLNDWNGKDLWCNQGNCEDGRQVREFDSLGYVTGYSAYGWDPVSRQWTELYKKFYYRENLGPYGLFIPDTAFLHALIEEGVDMNGDSLIQVEEAGIVSFLDVSDRTNIRDLTGIEGFLLLDTLYCQGNRLKRLDLVFNQKLACLNCSGNLLESLSLSGNPVLNYLDCSGNLMEELTLPDDLVLTYLDCSGNLLSRLDLPGEPDMLSLDCSQNLIGELDLAHQVELKWLDCSHNLIARLNLMETLALRYLSMRAMPSLREVCVPAFPFPPADMILDTTGSPNVNFTIECELGGDWLENNDWQSISVGIQEGTDYDSLYVTPGDDDWYSISISGDEIRTPVTVTCQFLSQENRIRMELVDADGIVLDTSRRIGDKERIVLFPLEPASYYLRIFVGNGTMCSYRLRWSTGEFAAETELQICDPKGSCSPLFIPVTNGGVLVMDTLEVELYSGDITDQAIRITNLGPDPYFFYPVLDLPESGRPPNPALSLNGYGSYIRVTRDACLEITEAITVEAWVKNGRGAPILSKGYNGKGYCMFLSDDGRLGFWTASTCLLSRTVLDSDGWNHVAASYDGTKLCLYINGIPDTTCQALGSMTIALLDLYMGSLHPMYPPTGPFVGELDEVRIWNIARKPWEIRTCMNRGLSGSEPGLAGYWPANMESLYVMKDLVSGNHGMFSGEVQWDESARTVVKYMDWPEDDAFIAPGGSCEFVMQIQAGNIPGGTYSADVALISGLPSTTDALLPIILHVTEAPGFSIHPDSVDLREIELYKLEQRMIEVSNTGTMELRIDSIRSDLEGTRITPDHVTLQAGEAAMFRSEYFMRFPGTYSGDFTFFTNDPSDSRVRVPISGSGENMNSSYSWLGSINDSVYIGYWKAYGKSFPNGSGSPDVILKPSIVTYTLSGDSYDLIPRADSIPQTWITTTLPEVCLLDPLEDKRFDIILDASGLTPGPYFADLFLEWFDPVHHIGIFPVRMQAVPEPQPSVDIPGTGGILIYPNPTRQQVLIHRESTGEYTLQLLSSSGRVLAEEHIEGNTHTHMLDLGGEPPGMYFIRIFGRDFVETAKIIRLD